MTNSNGIRLRHKVAKLFAGLTFFQRSLLILKLFSWLFASRLSQFRKILKQAFAYRASALTRGRNHWIGSNQRRLRSERVLIFTVFFGAMAILDPRDFMLWAIVWGCSISVLLNAFIVYRLVTRRRHLE